MIAPGVFVVVVLLATSARRLEHAPSVAFAQAGGKGAPSNQTLAADVPYVGSKICAGCHQAIYDKFSRTGMGRSMVQVTPALLEGFPTSGSLFDKDLNLHFDVYARDGKLYQSQFQTDSDGKKVFHETHEIEWIVGSGANGFGGLIREGDYVFQSPLSFYSKPQAWALSPGYEFGNYGFNRPILAGCIACHSGLPRPVAEGNGRFKDPPFSELAIGCEKCHGPGVAHVKAMREGNFAEMGALIVNPASLSPTLADNICMSCHQTGDVRVLKPGKDYQDFRPGDPLDRTLSIFLAPPKREAPPPSEHLEHYYSMTLSKCYRSSGGRLSCITCHDPHVEPSRAEASAYFAGKCLTCHTEKSCSVPLEVRRRKDPPDDCAGCHMPKRDIGVIVHSSITSHRITARANEPLPEAAFHQTTPALPDLIHLNSVPGEKNPPPRSTLLQAYGELMDNNPEYRDRYLTLLHEMEQTDAGSALVQAALGRRDLRSGKLGDAEAHLRRALEIGPPMPLTYADLAEVLDKVGRDEETVPLLQKAIDLDPFNPVLQKTMVVRLIQLKRYPSAESAMERYVELFPQDSFMRQMLARAKSAGRAQ
jgi:hypothetical protein